MTCDRDSGVTCDRDSGVTCDRGYPVGYWVDLDFIWYSKRGVLLILEFHLAMLLNQGL